MSVHGSNLDDGYIFSFNSADNSFLGNFHEFQHFIHEVVAYLKSQ